MEIKEQVKYVGRKLLLIQAQLAKKTGISAVTIARWESLDGMQPQMISYGKFLAYCEKHGIYFENDEPVEAI